jgi:CheY-like chemotaxis protein
MGRRYMGNAFQVNVTASTPMNPPPTPITILMADDEAGDRALTADALKDARLLNDLRFVEDGEQLMDYLYARGKFAPPAQTPRPGLILLDLNMPRKDGRTVLKEIKEDPDLRDIPVAILTASKDDEDVYRSYDLGVTSYIVKPVTFESLVDTLQSLERYYFQIVDLPKGPK